MDGHLARPALHPDADGHHAGERPHRHSFVVNSGTSAITVPYAYRQLRMWRNTPVASLTSRRSTHARARHARLRVGRGPRQRLPPAGRSSALLDDRERHRALHRLRQHDGVQPDRDAQPRHVQGAERCARVRRGHRAVGVGPRRLRRAHRRPHACSRRRSTSSRTWARSPRRRCPGWRARRRSTDTTAPTATLTVTARDRDRRHAGHAHRHRGRRRRRRRGGRRGLDRRRLHVAPGDAARRAGPTPGPRTARRATTIKVRASDDSGNLGAASAGASVTVNCPCSIWGNSLAAADRRRRRPEPGRGGRQVQVRPLRR